MCEPRNDFYQFLPPNGVREKITGAVEYFGSTAQAQQVADQRESDARAVREAYWQSPEGQAEAEDFAREFREIE